MKPAPSPPQPLKHLSSQLLADAVDLSTLLALREEAGHWYRKITALAEQHGPWQVAEHLPMGSGYLPTASSISLPAVMAPARIIEAFSPRLKTLLMESLGPQPLCDIDIAWLRRQYPSSLEPLVASPHGWHQDGAYGIDFTQHNNTDSSLLPMLTVWLPLHDCGEFAPGLELIPDSPYSALLPAQLNEQRIAQQWPEQEYWRPTMKPGDALVIAGHTLHRTYRSDSMTQLRGCVELRFLPSEQQAERLAAHQFIQPW